MKTTLEPSPRYWTRESIEKLATVFSLPNNGSMQDWPYEVADPKRLVEFFEALEGYHLEPNIQYTLMDIVFQSLEESKVDLLNSEITHAIEIYLKRNYSIHIYQIWYWSSFDSELIDGFRISSLLRKIWNDQNNS